jgi:hypothetical protein
VVEPSSPYAEAVERLGEAAMTNVADAVACGRAWAEAMGAAAAPTPPAPPNSPPPNTPPTNPADRLARAWVSAWVGGLKAVAVSAVAVTDAAAILAYPPQLVAYHDVDLAELLPERTLPVQLSIKGVEWSNTNAVGPLPVVTVVDAQPIAVPVPDDDGVVADTARVRVRPSVPFALDLTIELALLGTPAVPPATVVVRLGTHNVVLKP